MNFTVGCKKPTDSIRFYEGVIFITWIFLNSLWRVLQKSALPMTEIGASKFKIFTRCGSLGSVFRFRPMSEAKNGEDLHF